MDKKEKGPSEKKIKMSETKKENMPTVNDQYQRLIEARNFHYNNLNKWLMTFYVIIGALFVAFYSVKGEYQVVVAVVGYIASLSAWLSIKGYGFWENIWIEKIHRFEKNILKNTNDMQVYSYDYVDIDKHDNPYHPLKGANISTTKVAMFMTAFITISWGFLVMMIWFDIKNEIARIFVALIMSMGLSYLFMIGGTKLHPSIESENNTQSHKIAH